MNMKTKWASALTKIKIVKTLAKRNCVTDDFIDESGTRVLQLTTVPKPKPKIETERKAPRSMYTRRPSVQVSKEVYSTIAALRAAEMIRKKEKEVEDMVKKAKADAKKSYETNAWDGLILWTFLRMIN